MDVRQDARRRRTMRFVSRWRGFGIYGFGAFLLLGCLIGLLVFLRPSVSNVENRTLTALPAPTASSFLDGQFFSDLSLWYSDTYPLREQMVQADLGLESLYGIQPEMSLVGGNRVSEEIPDEIPDAAEDPEEESTDLDLAQRGDVAPPEIRAAAAAIEEQISDGVFSNGSAAYTLYYFSKQASDNYVTLINDAAKLLEGKADVYSILLPTNAGVMLSEEDLAYLGQPSQKQAIDYFYGQMSNRVHTVPTFDTLSEHKDEYLFFRTDFHWTQLAAYYVYESFCQVKGIEPAPYFEWEELVFDNYIGEYRDLTDVTGFTPDHVTARIPQGTNTVEYWTDDYNMATSRVESYVVEDLSDEPEDADKYSCFIGGNRPLTHINNPQVTDGSSCLVVKDSFGNPLVSTMVDSYQDIYCIDFRYTHQNLVNLVETYGIKDVIFENTLMFAGTNNARDLLAGIIYPPKSTERDLEKLLGPFNLLGPFRQA